MFQRSTLSYAISTPDALLGFCLLPLQDLVDYSDDPAAATLPVADVAFFGLQQLQPLMTEALLQYPSLASHYFTLVGFMVETYAER